MRITIKKQIIYADEINGNLGSDNNGFNFNYQYDGDSSVVVPDPIPTDVVIKDYLMNTADRKVYELKPGNSFSKTLIGDILSNIPLDNLVGVYIYCYESTKGKNFSLPIRFDVFIEDTDFKLGSMSEFSIGNIKELSSDIRIEGITVPTEAKANLVIILITKE